MSLLKPLRTEPATSPLRARTPYCKCPLCESVSFDDTSSASCEQHPLYRKELPTIINWKKCRDCSHVFTDGHFTEDACKLLFSNTNQDQQAGFDLERQRHLSSRIIDKVTPFSTSGYWLDVGFGNGSLLFTAQEYGFTPIGTDLRTDNAQRMANLGVRTYCEDISNLVLETECAVISMADVLEHMPYPKLGLHAAHRLLGPGGVLFISVPNIESVIWKAMDETGTNPYWGEIEHYHNFSRSRLYALLHECGFTPLRYSVSERYRASMEIIAQKS